MTDTTRYDDDRYGCMRIHIASERARLACETYTYSALRRHALTHCGPLPHKTKDNLAWGMAQCGLIDADGNLRDGFPANVVTR